MGFSFLDLLFPKTCVGCGKLGEYICASCKVSQKLHGYQICPACERNSFNGKTHQWCKNKVALSGVTSVFEYKPPISILIKQLKYRHGSDVASVMSEWFVNKLVLDLPMSQLTLVPIPLHVLRENWRGFNQSAILGRNIARVSGWGFEPNMLVRTRGGRHQVELKGRERRQNVEGIFKVSPAFLSGNSLARSSIILFDDVWTTGSTMKEAARVLKSAGMRFIWGLTIAR